MNINLIIEYIKEGDLITFYRWIFARMRARIFNKIILPLFHRNLTTINAVKVMDEYWDYLIVLDACRYDIFKKVVDKKANFVISGGTSTSEWMKWNFKKEYKDVIYIAGNPHFASDHLKKTLGFNPFYLVKEVWDYGWDNVLQTVPPEEVTKAALDALKTFPDKRMIIHYMQPHHPFLSDKELLDLDEGIWNTLENGLLRRRKKTIYDYARQGEISIERVKKAYKENLKIVWNEIIKLKEKLPGRLILTSDHGDLFGEYGLYGHRGGLRVESLVKVPWVILKDDKRESFKEIKGQASSRDIIREKIFKLKKIQNKR